MVRTHDGFEIAEVDLKLRGPGDLSGTQQSGILDMKIADLAHDQILLSHARETVIQIFTEDPNLQLDRHRLLLNYLERNSPAIFWDKIS